MLWFIAAVALQTAPATVEQVPDQAAQAPAQVGAVEEADSEARPGLDPNREVCRRFRVPGSRVNRHIVCLSAAEWERNRREAQQLTRRLQEYPQNHPNDSSTG